MSAMEEQQNMASLKKHLCCGLMKKILKKNHVIIYLT